MAENVQIAGAMVTAAALVLNNLYQRRLMTRRAHRPEPLANGHPHRSGLG